MSNSKINSLKDLQEEKALIKSTLTDFEEIMKDDLNKLMHPFSSIIQSTGEEEGFSSEKASKRMRRISNLIQIGTAAYGVYKAYKRNKYC